MMILIEHICTLDTVRHLFDVADESCFTVQHQSEDAEDCCTDLQKYHSQHTIERNEMTPRLF